MILPILLAAAQTMTFTADRIAVDNVTKAVVATGHVHAACGVMTLRGESLSRSADGVVRFSDPTYATTCTNELGHTHWNVTGEVEYRESDYVILRDCWVRFCEMPVFWMPYLWYPLDTSCGFAWMPGYTSRWGGFLMTRTRYNLVGDPNRQDDSAWLTGATRFDWRSEMGLALGEDLKWSLGRLGSGKFKSYYAWDNSDRYAANGIYDGEYNYRNWGSDVPSERYGLELSHVCFATERDVVRLKGSYYSDSMFQSDFIRRSFFNIKSQWLGSDGNEVAWEHNENAWGSGLSVSGPLNEFYGGTKRLPELYLDLMPQAVFSTPVVYESENRIGYLGRQAAEYGHSDRYNPYSYSPGYWADYEAFRVDSYHRFSVPFRTCDDVLAVVPRVAARGTAWNKTGATDLYGYDEGMIGKCDSSVVRSIIEGGVTFAARGTGSVGDGWQNAIEPYADVLLQDAHYSGLSNGGRPYVFDNLDASTIWEDQFAGRSRNLPYDYYGVTPGFRSAWSKLEENGRLREIFDIDAYLALQFNEGKWYEQREAGYICGNPDLHRLAKAGYPNYGDDGMVVPGFRTRWSPEEHTHLGTRAEFDTENDRIALAEVQLAHEVSRTFWFQVSYSHRDYRLWDYAAAPYTYDQHLYPMEDDAFNLSRVRLVTARCEQQICSWLAWSPFVTWDARAGELDCVGAWVDYLTDCLGFRLTASYENKYRTIDGWERDEDFNIGFTVYLRAFGPNGVFQD